MTLVNYTALACPLCSNQYTTNQSSFREFVMGTYQELKKANPRLPILVRECEGATAKLIARYGMCCTSHGTLLRPPKPLQIFSTMA